MRTILFTQCLQNDFVRPLAPDEPLPNQLHIGHAEANRLVQSGTEYGNLRLFLANYYRKRTSGHHAIHIRDWHDENDPMQKEHFSVFGAHCRKNTGGAEFIEALSIHAPEKNGDTVINSVSLNDFVDTGLEAVILGLGLQRDEVFRAGIIGVWTDVKVQYLCYDLRSRFPNAEIGLCSSLCASRSRYYHQNALQAMRMNLGVYLTDAITEFMEFMNIPVDLAQVFSVYAKYEQPIQTEAPLTDEQRQIVRYLFRDSSRILLKPLGGGFSGAKVFAVESYDFQNKLEVPQVLKIDTNPKIGKERAAVESVENLLGPSSPRMKEFVHMQNLGGIRYFFANMNNTQTTTLQTILKKIITGGDDPEKKRSAIQAVFKELDEQLFRRLYQHPIRDRLNLFQYYGYRPEYGAQTVATISNLLGVSFDGRDNVPFTAGNAPEVLLPNPARFYDQTDRWLSLPPKETDLTWVHGDLNLANLLSDDKHNFWMIDYFHTRLGHSMNDFAKMENDIKYILCPITGEQDLRYAIRMEEAGLLSYHGAASDLPEPFATIGLIIRTVRKLLAEHLTQEPDFREYRIALLRYSAHTITFDECNRWQKLLAAFATCLLSERILCDYS